MRPNFNILNEKNLRAIISKKSRMATWIVSKCKTHSRREKLVQNLKKYFEVDVFGKCGNKTVPGISSWNLIF